MRKIVIKIIYCKINYYYLYIPYKMQVNMINCKKTTQNLTIF